MFEAQYNRISSQGVIVNLLKLLCIDYSSINIADDDDDGVDPQSTVDARVSLKFCVQPPAGSGITAACRSVAWYRTRAGIVGRFARCL